MTIQTYQSPVPGLAAIAMAPSTSPSLTVKDSYEYAPDGRPCPPVLHVKEIGATVKTAPPAPQPFCLDKETALHVNTFPHQPANNNRLLPTTIANIQHILTRYEVQVRYDVIGKRLTFNIPGIELSADSGDTAMTEIISLIQMNGLQPSSAREYVAAIGDRNRFNPVAGWIQSKPWDGVDRVTAFQDCITVAETYPVELRNALVYRWLLSAVAAALLPEGFRTRGVLTFQGSQGIGKTSFLMSLVPDEHRAKFVKVDHHLDPSNKDSILGAACHWIVELGELDSSLKKDVARIKGHLTSTHDKVRRPYGREETEYPRRTVFAATVNDPNFLVDSTGNARWWTIEAVALNYQHGIDTQQLFAQLAVDLAAGAAWWLTQEEEQLLDQQNKSYLAVSVVRDRLALYMTWVNAQTTEVTAKHMTATRILELIGFTSPNNAQIREAVPILIEHFGRRKKIKGTEGWSIPYCDTFVSVEQGAS